MTENTNLAKLAINAVLAGLWTGLGIIIATGQPPSKAVIWGAAALALRTTVGLLAAAFGPGVPVDQ
jgi:sorbitol-specific phosphotransferase system component IIBC